MADVNRAFEEIAGKSEPEALAYLGDAVYELMVRREVIASPARLRELHARGVSFVRAEAQSSDLASIEALLTDMESDLVRRARNRTNRCAKHTKPQVYARATGLEALFGALYLAGDHGRIEFLFDAIRKEHAWTSSASAR